MSSIRLLRSSFRHFYHSATAHPRASLGLMSTQHPYQQQHQHIAWFTTGTGMNSAPTKATTSSSKAKVAASSATNASSNVLRMEHLVKTVAETHELSQAESRRIIDTIVDTITDALSDNKKVALSSFGSFSTYTAKERHYRHPRTGADILTPSKERVRFKAFAGLKKIVEHQK